MIDMEIEVMIPYLINSFHFHNYCFFIRKTELTNIHSCVNKLLYILNCSNKPGPYNSDNIKIKLNEKYPSENWGGNLLHFLIDILCHCNCQEFDSTLFLYLLFKLIESNLINLNSYNIYNIKPLSIITYNENFLSYKINMKFIIFNMITKRYINRVKIYFNLWKKYTTYSTIVKKIEIIPFINNKNYIALNTLRKQIISIYN